MTEFELLEELARELSLPEIEPDEVTAQLVADYTGCSWSKASAVLKAKLAAGEVTSAKSARLRARLRPLTGRWADAALRLPLRPL